MESLVFLSGFLLLMDQFCALFQILSVQDRTVGSKEHQVYSHREQAGLIHLSVGVYGFRYENILLIAVSMWSYSTRFWYTYLFDW